MTVFWEKHLSPVLSSEGKQKVSGWNTEEIRIKIMHGLF